ncbi:MAG: alpha/beta hydrolase [Myxococcota bacterium]
MTHSRINLQNTPETPGVAHRAVDFERDGITLNGTLYLPVDRAGSVPAVVVAGAWTTVKEQMPGTYARALASRGFAALAFDFAGWGESQGEPRYLEDPETKAADIGAAAGCLAAQPEVDSQEVSGLGICASSGYMASAVADGELFSKLALVAPWLHTPATAEDIYGGAAATRRLIEAGRAAARSPEPQFVVAASTTDDTSLMFQAPYYTEPDRGLVETYDNQFNVASWEPWLTYDAQASADRLEKPTLVVCSEGAALPASAHAYIKRTQAPITQLWLDDDITQFDFYDRQDVVCRSVDAVAEHFTAK